MAKGTKIEIDFGLKSESNNNLSHQTKQALKLLPKNEHQLKYFHEKIKGKNITKIGKFFVDESEKAKVLKELKKRLSCGGNLDGEYVVLQGEHKTKAEEYLRTLGWR